MKTIKIVVVAALVVLVSGCVNQQKVREQYVIEHPGLAEDVQQAILNGEIKIGMTKQEVIASWGVPCGYCYGTKKSSYGDTWEYNPFGTGRYSIGAGTYIYFDANGRVKAWSR